MQLRPLGRTGFRIAPLVLGGNVFGWTCGRETSFRVLDAFVARGFNLIDTADVYSRWVPGHAGGESETILGEWIRRRGRHDDVLITTKVGSDLGLGHVCLRREHLLAAVEGSLRRLGVDCIDLYQSHWVDKDTPVEETLAAFQTLIEQGKVRAIGASNHRATRLRAALDAARIHGLPAYQTLQPPCNLLQRAEFEGELAALCRQENLGVISYYGLASGFLTGKYRTAADARGRARGDAVQKLFALPQAGAVLAALDSVAKKHDATPAQIALTWVMAQPGITAPIASATSVAQLEELAGAAALTLDPDDLAALDAASTPPSATPAPGA